jgi:FtsH-binding integral membrane protein
MFAGLLVTSLTAFVVASSPALIEAVILNRMVFWVLILAQLGLVFFLSARVEHMAPTTAAGLFILYSALTGVTASVILLVYSGSSIASTFVITAGMFGALAVFGTITRKDISGWGSFLFMGLIGLILASIVGIFWQNDALQFVISIIGVFIFTGLTAYDAQRLKHMALALPDGRVGSFAVVGALSLYLDFINLFFFLLRLLGGRRD